MTKLSRKKVRKAIEGCYGVFSTIAGKCNVSRAAITKFFKKERNKDLLDLVEQEGERIIDLAEKIIHKKIAENDRKAAEFILKTKGRKRGFVTKQEIDTNALIGIKGYANVSPDNWPDISIKSGTIEPSTVPN